MKRDPIDKIHSNVKSNISKNQQQQITVMSLSALSTKDIQKLKLKLLKITDNYIENKMEVKKSHEIIHRKISSLTYCILLVYATYLLNNNLF